MLIKLLLSLLLIGCVHAIQRIEHPDGRVEFTDGRAPALPTNQRNRVGNSVFSFTNEHGQRVFSDQHPGQGVEVDELRFYCFACQADSTIDWQRIRLFPELHREIINRQARSFGLDPALVQAVIHAESAFNANALSPKGAQGLMQLMPATAAELGVQNAFDIEENIYGGVKYLAQMLNQHQGSVRLATAAYNAGPGAVRRHGGIPPFAETQAYVERVAILHQRYRQHW